jgi:DNA recombination protein RmuC
MIEIAIAVGVLLALVLLVIVLVSLRGPQQRQSEQAVALAARLDGISGELARIEGSLKMMSGAQEGRLQGLEQSMSKSLEVVRTAVDEKLAQTLAESRGGRAELAQGFGAFEQRVEARWTALNERLKEIQADSASKLEEMRKVVDEKLQATLERSLDQSFKQVSERLDQVHRGLGEMQTLAAGVGDLKRVLTNVKARGTWGEFQLEAMIEQILTPDQYAKNVATRPGASERVEFAIRLPGRDEGHPVWLPIDAKFPVEDYQRLMDAHDRADLEQIEAAARALEGRIRSEARTIKEKYVSPPHTTDFAVMYLPTEGLYAEVLRRPGLAESIQREHRVTISGPTNLAALLNSLQMGFRTLAIEKRASDVWQVLGQVKTEFARFGEVVASTQKKLEAATSQFSLVGVRTRAIERKLREVEALPAGASETLPIEPVDADSDAGADAAADADVDSDAGT